MLVLAIRSDKPEAELHLLRGGETIDKIVWQAHRELSASILQKIDGLLLKNKQQKKDLEAIICFTVGGSFTGLRIAASVANVLAYSYQIPVVSSGGKDWLAEGSKAILQGKFSKQVLPVYDSAILTTKPKK